MLTKFIRDTHSFRISTLIPKQFGDYFDKNVKGYTYNIKKDNELLDKAGYKKKGHTAFNQMESL